MKSGLPLNECLAIIARESPEPLAGEFREVIEQQRVGVTLGEALERLTTRMPLPEVRFLADRHRHPAAGGRQPFGGAGQSVGRAARPLPAGDEGQGAERRGQGVGHGAGLAAAGRDVHGLWTAPEYIMPLFNTRPATLRCCSAALWMLTGVLVMRKMINFKF